MNAINVKKIIFTIFLAILVFGVQKCFAYNPEIIGYHINIDVGENKVLTINENIKTVFYGKMHYFTKIIPITDYKYDSKGKESYNVKVSKITTDKQFILNKDLNNNHIIKMGSDNTFFENRQNFNINYLYKLPPDNYKTKDELYFNIIDTSQEAPIENLTFSIKMPQIFNKDKIRFYDKFGESQAVIYKVVNNFLVGRYNGTLYPNDYLGIKIDLPEGYFKKGVYELFLWVTDIVAIIIPLIALFILSLLWQLNYKKGKSKIVDQIFPVENLNAVDTAYIRYQNIDKKCVPAIFLQLANKGYLNIERDFNNKNEYRIINVKSYEEEDFSESLFINTFFKNNNKILTSRILRNKSKFKKDIFSKAVDYTKKKFDDIFQTKLFFLKKVAIAIMLLTWIIVCLFIGIKIGFGVYLFYFGVLLLLSYVILSTGLTLFIQKKQNIYLTIFLIMTSMIIFTAVANAVLVDNPQLIFVCLLTFVSIVFMDILRFNMTSFTNKGDILYKRILGFENSIAKINAQKLQSIINKQNTYFYDILPYAISLGLGKKWFNKLSCINCPVPIFIKEKGLNIEMTKDILNLIIKDMSNF